MVYSSALTILPRFLWKLIIDHLSTKSIFMLRAIKSCKAIFTNAYCKELILSNKTGKIILIKTNSSVIKNFWMYALDNYIEHNDFGDTLRSIEKKKIMRYIHITIFIKAGIYNIQNMQNTIRLHDKNCSISINGSKTGLTVIARNIQQDNYYYPKIRVAQYVSIKYITFDVGIHLDGKKKVYNSQRLNLYECIFNYGIGQCSIQHSSITKCIIRGNKELCILACNKSDTVCIVKDSILNTKKCITIINKNIIHITLENNTILYAEYIIWFILAVNINILVKNNTISNIDNLVGFDVNLSKYTHNNIVIMQDNNMNCVFNKHQAIKCNDVINDNKPIDLSTKYTLAINNTNTLTNCGFTVDQS